MALVAGALALLAQTWAQSQLSPTRTAIIMSMEPVFAAFFAVLLGGEEADLRMVLGGAMVLAAMLVVEVGPRRTGRGRGPAPHRLTALASRLRHTCPHSEFWPGGNRGRS